MGAEGQGGVARRVVVQVLGDVAEAGILGATVCRVGWVGWVVVSDVRGKGKVAEAGWLGADAGERVWGSDLSERW